MENPQSSDKPVVYVLHGDDSHAIRKTVDSMLKQMGDPSIVDLNLTRLDGKQSNEDALYSSANAMPFLAERRMVILTAPFARLNSDAARKRFVALLDGLPSTTALVLVIEDQFERRDWKSLHSAHWLRRWMTAAGSRAHYKLCQLPAMNRMPEWVREEARRQGGQFNPEAAAALVGHVGNDTQLASLEVNKLLTFVDFKRPIEVEDVEDLTAQGGQADVFEMVDALASGSSRQAMAMLHRLLETQDPFSLFGMVVRQFRLLIQARELIDEGRGGQAGSELRLPGFVADKLTGQARRFSMGQLEAVYHRLLLMDESIKTGQTPAELAFDIFISELSQ
jgi:DNA polymerase III subunit delta